MSSVSSQQDSGYESGSSPRSESTRSLPIQPLSTLPYGYTRSTRSLPDFMREEILEHASEYGSIHPDRVRPLLPSIGGTTRSSIPTGTRRSRTKKSKLQKAKNLFSRKKQKDKMTSKADLRNSSVIRSLVGTAATYVQRPDKWPANPKADHNLIRQTVGRSFPYGDPNSFQSYIRSPYDTGGSSNGNPSLNGNPSFSVITLPEDGSGARPFQQVNVDTSQLEPGTCYEYRRPGETHGESTGFSLTATRTHSAGGGNSNFRNSTAGGMPSWSDDPSSFALDPNRMWQSEHPLANRSSGGTTNQPTNNAPAGQPTGQISSRPTTASPTVPVDFATNQRRDTTKKIIMSMGGYGIHEESLRDTEFENWTSLYRNLGPNEKRARSEMHEAYVESMTEESIKLGIDVIVFAGGPRAPTSEIEKWARTAVDLEETGMDPQTVESTMNAALETLRTKPEDRISYLYATETTYLD
ncbi:MAG: hypothetical protein TREMPRED_003436, partial [Tremellales sp. Tagirdzhanova-0007]